MRLAKYVQVERGSNISSAIVTVNCSKLRLVVGASQRPRKVKKSGGSKRGRSWRARERKPIKGVWGRSPQRCPGVEPLVRGQGAKPPEAEKLLLLDVNWKRQICPYSPCIADSVFSK